MLQTGPPFLQEHAQRCACTHFCPAHARVHTWTSDRLAWLARRAVRSWMLFGGLVRLDLTKDLDDRTEDRGLRTGLSVKRGEGAAAVSGVASEGLSIMWAAAVGAGKAAWACAVRGLLACSFVCVGMLKCMFCVCEFCVCALVRVCFVRAHECVCVRLCACVCMHLCANVLRLCMFECVCGCTYVRCEFVRVCVYACMCVHVCVRCVCLCLCVCVCFCACVWVWVGGC